MTVYCVTGHLGSGKSLICAGRIQDAIRSGKRVVTNFNLFMEHLTRGGARTNVVRIKDWPTLEDLKLIGIGNPLTDETRNGIIVLDEISSILGARTWNEKGREALVDWLKHSRKLGWDLYFIVQHESMLDAMVRKALCEHIVICKRLDRLPIPLVGWFLKVVGFSGRFLQMHLATVKYSGAVQERWWYKGLELRPAYDTRQIFSAPAPGRPQGPSSYLDRFSAPWLAPKVTWWDRFIAWLGGRSGAVYEALYARLWSAPASWFDIWASHAPGVFRYPAKLDALHD